MNPAPFRAESNSEPDRRIALRRQPAMGTICRLEDGLGMLSLALIWNISSTGVSMLLSDAPSAGASMDGTLETITEGHALRVKMTVVHIKQVETGDYFVGARFEHPLQEIDIKPFVSA